MGKYRLKRKGLPFRTLIRPSSDGVKRHLKSLQTILKKYQHTLAMIKALTPVIRGWCNYYRSFASTTTFTKCQHILMQNLLTWAFAKHRKRPKKWVFGKYFKRIWAKDKFGVKINRSRLRFGAESDGNWITPILHADIRIKRHVKVKGSSSPYDGDFVYWSLRNRTNPMHSPKFLSLLKKQKGRCPHCNLFFLSTDVIEIDHIVPQSKGGRSTMNNLQLLHGNCHDAKSRLD